MIETIFLGIVVFLCVLAVFDLVVGVSNDAVNFINSAIGAKAAPFKVIIAIAAVGVFAGAYSFNSTCWAVGAQSWKVVSCVL